MRLCNGSACPEWLGYSPSTGSVVKVRGIYKAPGLGITLADDTSIIKQWRFYIERTFERLYLHHNGEQALDAINVGMVIALRPTNRKLIQK